MIYMKERKKNMSFLSLSNDRPTEIFQAIFCIVGAFTFGDNKGKSITMQMYCRVHEFFTQ